MGSSDQQDEGDTLGKTLGQGWDPALATSPEIVDRLTLTIVCHPDGRRIGDVFHAPAPGPGDEILVSRAEPVFSPRRRSGEPLPISNPYVSKSQKLRVRWGADGKVSLVPPEGRRVGVNGAPLNEIRALSLDSVRDGVVIEFSAGVVLLLHLSEALGVVPDSHGLVGESDGVQRVRQLIGRVARYPLPVLIRGESGTGKELVANALHAASKVSEGPFVPVNMANLGSGTAVSELFGHVRGAFSGATKDHPGYFGSAAGGTLFLDEIGDTPTDVQPMLLRVLEGGDYQPVGASASRQARTRILAATDARLEEAIKEGRFRAQIFHRLVQYEIDILPLRARRDDVGRLLVHFLREELEEMGKGSCLDRPDAEASWLPGSVVARLVSCEWSGNVRQLRNVAKQLAIHNQGRDQARLTDGIERLLSEGSQREAQTAAPDVVREASPPPAHVPDPRRRPSTIGRDELRRILRSNRWKIEVTAKQLGMSKTTLYKLMKKYEIPMAGDKTAAEITAALAQTGGDVDAAAFDVLEVSDRGLLNQMKKLGIEG